MIERVTVPVLLYYPNAWKLI